MKRDRALLREEIFLLPDINNPGETGSETSSAGKLGAQTLLRGLTILEYIAQGITDDRELMQRLDIPRSTIQRILDNLVSEGYLYQIPYSGYTLGHKLIYLGSRALGQRPLIDIAHPALEELALETSDTVHMGVPEGYDVLYLDKIPGSKGLEMRSRVGQKMPLAATGLGKSLMFGMQATDWKRYYDDVLQRKEDAGSEYPKLASWPEYKDNLLNYKKQGWAMDLEENEVGIRCVSAPVRDQEGAVIAAISISSAIFYMSHERMQELGPLVASTARKISEKMPAANKSR